jgi:gluconate kinase
MKHRDAHVLVMFGLPGAGKTFVAKRLVKRGFYFHDGDDDLPADMRRTIARAMPVTEAMRNRFVARLIRHVATLHRQHERLVVAQTFLKHRHRLQFLKRFPEATFILVTSDAKTRARRLAHRHHQPLDPRAVARMVALFERARAPYRILRNTTVRAIDQQLSRLTSDPPER